MLIESTPTALKISYLIQKKSLDKNYDPIKNAADYTAILLEQLAKHQNQDKAEVIEKFIKEMETIKNGKQVHYRTIKSINEVPIKI